LTALVFWQVLVGLLKIAQEVGSSESGVLSNALGLFVIVSDGVWVHHEWLLLSLEILLLGTLLATQALLVDDHVLHHLPALLQTA
jgi:hypothetical protein